MGFVKGRDGKTAVFEKAFTEAALKVFDGRYRLGLVGLEVLVIEMIEITPCGSFS